MIQIECLYRTKFFDPDPNLDCNLYDFAPCEWGIRSCDYRRYVNLNDDATVQGWNERDF